MAIYIDIMNYCDVCQFGNGAPESVPQLVDIQSTKSGRLVSRRSAFVSPNSMNAEIKDGVAVSSNGSAKSCSSPHVPTDLRNRVFAMERQENWDFDGGKAIRRCDCEAAVEFLEVALRDGVRTPNSVAPSPLGRVALSWRIGANLVYLEILAEDKDHLYFQWGGPTDGAKEGTIEITDFINRLLRLTERGRE